MEERQHVNTGLSLSYKDTNLTMGAPTSWPLSFKPHHLLLKAHIQNHHVGVGHARMQQEVTQIRGLTAFSKKEKAKGEKQGRDVFCFVQPTVPAKDTSN